MESPPLRLVFKLNSLLFVRWARARVRSSLYTYTHMHMMETLRGFTLSIPPPVSQVSDTTLSIPPPPATQVRVGFNPASAFTRYCHHHIWYSVCVWHTKGGVRVNPEHTPPPCITGVKHYGAAGSESTS